MNYLIGIEREGFRVNFSGEIAKTPHPQEFGNKLENPLIGTDFGEPMLELRTHPHSDTESCYRELLEITSSTLKVLFGKGELLWPYSVPYKVPDENEFPYNCYPGRPDMEEHERLITRVYGLRRNCLSGIHVNFSIGYETLEEIRQIYPTLYYDRDEVYLRCANGINATNTVLRERFGISEKNKSIVSRIIKDTVEKGYIRLYDDSTAPRYYRYVPYWA